MARLLVLGAALLSWIAAFVATSDAEAGTRMVRRLALVMPLRVSRMVSQLAISRPVSALLRFSAVRNLCDEFVARLNEAVPSLVREEACATLMLLSATATALVCLVVRSLIAVPIMVGGGVVSLVMWEASRARNAERELVQAMPGVFRTLSMAMGSGETLAQAVAYVGDHEQSAAGRAFKRASLRLRCGESVAEALDKLVEELDAPGVGLLATALSISQRTGSPLRSLFQHSASLVERQGEFERALAVKTAQVRLSVRIVSLLPPLMVSLLSLLSPDFRRGLFTPMGMGCVLLSALMDGAALFIIRRLMRGVL